MASALRTTLRLTLMSNERGLGPNAMPPPVRTGDLTLPARARPVPFWRYIFAVVPETSPRVLVEAVPRRRAACSARTTRCSVPTSAGTAKSAALRSRCSSSLPSASTTVATPAMPWRASCTSRLSARPRGARSGFAAGSTAGAAALRDARDAGFAAAGVFAAGFAAAAAAFFAAGLVAALGSAAFSPALAGFLAAALAAGFSAAGFSAASCGSVSCAAVGAASAFAGSGAASAFSASGAAAVSSVSGAAASTSWFCLFSSVLTVTCP